MVSIPVVIEADLDSTILNTNVSSYAVSAPTVGVDPYIGQVTITTQRLDIEYYREPFAYPNYTTSSFSLSNAPENVWSFWGSQLRLKISAHNEQRILSGTFQGSSILIPQTFNVHINDQDIHGNTMDGVSGTSGIAGPQGVVLTKQVGVYRRPTQTGDTEWSQSVANVMSFGEVSGSQSMWIWPNTRYWGDWDLVHADAWAPRQDSGPWYFLGGPYDPTKEDPKQVVLLIEQIVRRLKDTGFYDQATPVANLVKLPKYDPNFHNYNG